MPEPIDSNRSMASLIGLAVGDAVGTTLEFRQPGSFEPIEDMIGGGPFQLNPGEWTDDTSMALCLADSILETGGFDPADQLTRYIRWRDDGYLSSNGRCFDIGGTVSDALQRFERTGVAMAGSTHPRSAGNGSLMRLAPIAMAYGRAPERAIELAAEMSKTTHGAEEAVDACRYFCGLLIGACSGAKKAALLAPLYSPVRGLWERAPLSPGVAAVASGSILAKSPPDIRGTGYVIESLEAALWAFAHHDDFESAVLAAANLGDDADTTAAICGQIAGAFHGLEAIPMKWRERLARRDMVEGLATSLVEFGTA